MPTDLLLTAPYTLQLETLQLEPYDEPPPKPGEVRARALLSALSHGTEVSLYRAAAPFHEGAFDPAARLFRPAEAAQSYPAHLPLPHRETHTFRPTEMVAHGVEPLSDLEPERAALFESLGMFEAFLALELLAAARCPVFT